MERMANRYLTFDINDCKILKIILVEYYAQWLSEYTRIQCGDPRAEFIEKVINQFNIILDCKLSKLALDSGVFTPNQLKSIAPKFYMIYLHQCMRYRHWKYNRRYKKYLKLKKQLWTSEN